MNRLTYVKWKTLLWKNKIANDAVVFIAQYDAIDINLFYTLIKKHRISSKP